MKPSSAARSLMRPGPCMPVVPTWNDMVGRDNPENSKGHLVVGCDSSVADYPGARWQRSRGTPCHGCCTKRPLAGSHSCSKGRRRDLSRCHTFQGDSEKRACSCHRQYRTGNAVLPAYASRHATNSTSASLRRLRGVRNQVLSRSSVEGQSRWRLNSDGAGRFRTRRSFASGNSNLPCLHHGHSGRQRQRAITDEFLRSWLPIRPRPCREGTASILTERLRRYRERSRAFARCLEGWPHAPVAHPSRLAVKNGEHLRMTAVGMNGGHGADTPLPTLRTAALRRRTYTAQTRTSN